MDELLVFFQQYGLWLTIIAVLGIVILGVLKYCKVFSKLEEKVRHILYLVISVGLSIIGSVIYLACVHQLDISYIAVLAIAIFALNQAAYTIYDTTTLKELVAKLLDWIKGLITSGKAQEIIDETTKEETTTEEKEEVKTDVGTEDKKEE